MDFFFCLPIIFGCKTTVKPEGDQTSRICPRCHNAAVASAESREWFELCFVPIVPMSKKHIWTCAVCNWSIPIQTGWEPQPVSSMASWHPAGYYPPQGWQQPGHFQPGPKPHYGPSGDGGRQPH